MAVLLAGALAQNPKAVILQSVNSLGSNGIFAYG